MSNSVKQAKKFEAEGDFLFKQEKYAEALSAYEKAVSYDQSNTALYDKLIQAHSLSTEEWNMEEFTRELSWAMEREALDNPRLARLHEKLSPDFKPIYKLIIQLAVAGSEEEEEQIIDEIMAYGEKAIVPLLEFIRTLKTQQEP